MPFYYFLLFPVAVHVNRFLIDRFSSILLPPPVPLYLYFVSVILISHPWHIPTALTSYLSWTEHTVHTSFTPILQIYHCSLVYLIQPFQIMLTEIIFESATTRFLIKPFTKTSQFINKSLIAKSYSFSIFSFPVTQCSLFKFVKLLHLPDVILCTRAGIDQPINSLLFC
jgi:hypothetical protein